MGDFSSTYTMDIPSGQADNNYTYDVDGNLTGDVQEGHTMSWNARGKVQKVDETASSNDTYFAYDALGRRVRKYLKGASVTNYAYIYHVYDASGNIIASYDVSLATAPEGKYRMDYKLAELDLYGSQRIGVLKNYYTTALATATAAWSFEADGDFTGTPIATTAAKTSDANFNKRIVGDKQLELSNHLGNVAVVVTDRKVGVDAYKFNFSILSGTHSYQSYSNEYTPGGGLFVAASGTDQTIDYYLADVVSYADYYSHGMLMPDRFGNTSGYRYGFNGMENDNELKGIGNSIDFGERIYDSRLGRFSSVDPLTILYPGQSPYVYASNNPIRFIDVDGEGTGDPFKDQYNKSGNVLLVIIDDQFMKQVTSWKVTGNTHKKWDVFIAGSLQDASARLAKTYGKDNLSISNLIIRTHSNLDFNSEQAPIGNSGGLNIYHPGYDNGNLNHNIFESYDAGSSLSIYKEAKALKDITERVSDGGNILLTACGLGYHASFMESFSKFKGGSKSYDIYQNFDQSAGIYSTNSETHKGIINIGSKYISDGEYFGKGWLVGHYDGKSLTKRSLMANILPSNNGGFYYNKSYYETRSNYYYRGSTIVNAEARRTYARQHRYQPGVDSAAKSKWGRRGRHRVIRANF